MKRIAWIDCSIFGLFFLMVYSEDEICNVASKLDL